MSLNHYEIALVPSGRRIEASKGQTLFQALARVGIQLRSECGGKGVCTKCLVAIQEGSAKESHRPMGMDLGRRPSYLEEHLACQWEVQSNLTVEIPFTSLAPAEVITTQPLKPPAGKAITLPAAGVMSWVAGVVKFCASSPSMLTPAGITQAGNTAGR